MRVDVPLVSITKCNEGYANTGSSVTEDTICGGFSTGGHDSCQGDSGGPLVYNFNDNWFQVGVVSWGIGCGLPNLPGVYSSVFYHLNWVKKFITRFPYDVLSPSNGIFPAVFEVNLFSSSSSSSSSSSGVSDYVTIIFNNTDSQSPISVNAQFLTPSTYWSIDKTSCIVSYGKHCAIKIEFAPNVAGLSETDLVLTTTATLIGESEPKDFSETFQVCERSERALRKTSILAMNSAKWLQTATWLHQKLN